MTAPSPESDAMRQSAVILAQSTLTGQLLRLPDGGLT